MNGARGTAALVGAVLAALMPVGALACGSSPQAAFGTFIAAFNSLDWPTLRSCLADSVSLFGPANPGAVSLHRLDGRAAVERSFRAVFDAASADGAEPRGPDIRPQNVLLQQISGAALVTFEFERAEHSFGRRSILFSKQGGTWRIVHIHASNVTESP